MMLTIVRSSFCKLIFYPMTIWSIVMIMTKIMVILIEMMMIEMMMMIDDRDDDDDD